MIAPILLSAGETAASFLDSEVISFITNSAKSVIGLFSVQPLGTFIAIGLVGSVVGVVGGLISMVKH